jgi:serine/threonine protein kinase
MPDLQPTDPPLIGPYRLVSRVGSGGMGVVYLAEDPNGRQVALKLIRPELAEDASFRSRFRREVRAGQLVGGICTARYIDADVESERPYLVTEYVEGGNLADYVATHGPLAEEQLIGLAVGLAEAVVAIHASGVIHRDLKPTNVLMAPSGPKVVDFGISHAADGTAVTQSGTVVGSPSWMAPEQAQGRETTPAVDVFSWGATVAFAATGRSPFGEGRPDAVIYRVVHEEPDLAGVDPRLRPLIEGAMAKEPSARPSPDQLLVAVVKTAMSGAVPPGGSVAMATVVLDRTWKQPTVAAYEPPPRRARQLAWIAAAVVIIAAFVAGVLYVAHGDQAKKPGRDATSTTSVHRSSKTRGTVGTPTTTTTSTDPSQSPTASITADLPLVVCPTTYGVEPSPTPTALPQTMQVAAPRDLASQLAVYSDQLGGMKLVAPQGWTCSADYGADGSGGVSVYPSGEDLSTSSTVSPSDEEISGGQTSACVGCMEEQACPLFSTAAADYERDYTMSCDPPPSTESVVSLSAGVTAFSVPAGTTGTGITTPSDYPTNGVMTYYSGNDNGSWTDSCTLPASQQALCTVVLNRFVDWYGTN